jgi:hypothetical protein
MLARALALACSAVTKMLTDADDYMREMARFALRKLKRQRARLHWVTARVYRARPYARFWHEYVGEKLYALGGVWTEHDSAAFAYEYI